MHSLKNKKALSTIMAAAIVLLVIGLAAIAAAYYIWILPGNQKTQTYSFTDFAAIDASSAFKVTITQSETYSIVITANQNMFDQIEVTKMGNTLKIDTLPGAILGIFNAEAKIAMPKLENIKLSGASHGTAQGFSSQEPFTAAVTGASSLDLSDLQAGNITIDLSGASTLTASGSANDLTSVVSGASNLNTQNLIVNNAKMNISGASHASINLNGRLDVEISGASSLEYTGNPTLGNINSSGSSTVTKR